MTRSLHNHWLRSLRYPLLLIAPACLLVVLQQIPAAAFSCVTGKYYEPRQYSANYDYNGIDGNITQQTIATHLAGTPGNGDDGQHLLLYIALANPSATCFLGAGICWNQVGVGMGLVGDSHCTSIGQDYTQEYQVYYEDDSPSNCTDAFFPGISINPNANYFTLAYDGSDGYTGYPQVQGYVINSAGNSQYIASGEMSGPTGHAAADTEIWTGSSTSCPALTAGSPYQNFGTTAGGSWDNGDFGMGVATPTQGWIGWAGGPSTYSASPYYYDKLPNYPGDYRANGPADSGV